MSNDDGRFSEAKVNELAAKRMEEIAHERGARNPQPSVRLDFSVEVNELLTRAESDPVSAMKLLEMLAKNLRARTLPNRMLADSMADAIEAAAAKPTAYQARALTDELHLTSQAQRPAASWLVIGPAVQTRIDQGVSKTKAVGELAAEYDVDPKTIRNYYKHYVTAKQKHDAIE
jgi:hypothetical protein